MNSFYRPKQKARTAMASASAMAIQIRKRFLERLAGGVETGGWGAGAGFCSG
jgi:hypothetical protein